MNNPVYTSVMSPNGMASIKFIISNSNKEHMSSMKMI